MTKSRDPNPHSKDSMDGDREPSYTSSIPLVDAAKKLFSVGVSAAFMTEESIRSALSDIKLPKEVLQFILNSANKGKEELVQRVGKEIGALISHIDLVKEFSRFAETHKFKISAEIDITPKKNLEKSEPTK